MKFSLIATIIASSIGLAACGGGSESASTQNEVSVDSVVMNPLGSITTAGYYLSPAQVRTRYGFDGLPNTPEAKGSGQLIAIVGAYNALHLADNLAAFSTKFGLPQCTTVSTAVTNGVANIAHPAAKSGCTLQIINVDGNGKATATPGQSGAAVSSWSAETSMDIEWAHAMAPMASIVVIQAPTAFVSSMQNGVAYASNVAKADVVSMSWGSAEKVTQCVRKAGQPTVQVDPKCSDAALIFNFWNASGTVAFTGNSTFVAASGDAGTLQWPALDPRVLAVGGTVVGAKTDIGWSGSGGGVSIAFTAPKWQPPITKLTMRAVPDVAYDAGTPVAIYITPDAATGWGDASCVTLNGTAKCGWYGGGGTSAGAPQWAGIVAIAKAMRLANNSPDINYQSTMYSIAQVPGWYATAFGDVVAGSTKTNTSKNGYDLVTGLGTPNTSYLISYLVR